MVDETGSAGIFHTENTQIEPGSMYVFLVSNNRIMRYIHVDEFEDIERDAWVRWMQVDQLNIDPSKKVVVAYMTRHTKAGKPMANVLLSSHDKKLQHVIVFNKMYARSLGLMKPGAVVQVRLGELDDGTKFVKEIVNG
jgi:hypothetical protein